MQNLQLQSIPDNQYAEYRYETIFKAYKWDPQVEDRNTVSQQVLLISRKTALELKNLGEALAAETVAMEAALQNRPDLVKKLALPKPILKALRLSKTYSAENHVRLMRFDFHPTETGWAISEVNSDVPGGLAEASILPQIANTFFPNLEPFEHVGKHLLNAFQKRVAPNQTIAFVHATSYSDDRQVMQFLGDYFDDNSYQSLYIAPDHLTWDNKQAYCILQGSESNIGGIIRFFPLEWLIFLPKKSKWQGYFETTTPSCNHPVSILTQSKRLPLVWDDLGLSLPAWKQLLPQTTAPNKTLLKDSEWVMKPALGRVGEGISVKEAITKKELAKIERSVKKDPKYWVAQKKFKSKPILDEYGNPFHLCIGVFVVDGKFAGFYSRTSPYPLIDAKAKDIPVLVEKDGIYE